MSYEKCLELAGATVHDSRHFGSYQGEWIAVVTFEGHYGFVWDYFGSCTGCDAFEAEFSGTSHDHKNPSEYWYVYNDFRVGCPECDAVRERMRDFGRGYLEGILSYEQARERASKNIEWDAEAKDMLRFVEEHKDRPRR